MRKEIKTNSIMIAACIFCFLLFPLLCVWLDRENQGKFTMIQFFPLIFWPMAGAAISAIYAWKAKKRKWVIAVPALTAACLITVNLIVPEFSFLLSLLCLIFELAGMGMIYFWSRM